MSSKFKQAVNVERRKWDKKAYEAKAKARAKSQKAEGSSNNGPVRQAVGTKRPLFPDDEESKEEFTPAAADAAGPAKSKRAYLKARRGKVDIDSKIGSTEMVSAEAAATIVVGPESMKDGITKTGVGWHCKVCDCFLKDSHTYLDHINGRKHQRNLGYSMRTERSTKEQVQTRLEQLVSKRQEKADGQPTAESFEDVVRGKDEEADRRKKERAKRRAERKKQAEKSKQEAEEAEEAEVDPALAAMLGFSGFGGGKNR